MSQRSVLIPSSAGRKLKIESHYAPKQMKKTRSHQITFSLHNELQATAKHTLGITGELVDISFNGNEVNVECYSLDACLRLYSDSLRLAANAKRFGASTIVLRVNGAIEKKIPVDFILQMNGRAIHLPAFNINEILEQFTIEDIAQQSNTDLALVEQWVEQVKKKAQ
ncbi:hypothetical protein H6F86_02005 [Phormidium sp. FACHB-592]|uniref:Uncharacterized protein n=1 Tax=Stenomitos frigidus AS-A4 TaxID=2933935 RepID=A0ABV0KKC3_9CYAN|nr:hypothetical protein [Phormidium sp. FACHB-592]MBD2072680.1 hypothetical protein [Phormidium sp. FACHB-592]